MRTLIVLIAALVITCPGLSLAGDGAAGGANEATTVKSGKSNSSDRLGGAAGGGAADATTVKSSKSNSSERTGGAAGGAEAAPGMKVKGSKSNTSE